MKAHASQKAYLVAVDMGYGHQRALFPLESIGVLPSEWGKLPSTVITANTYPGIPLEDKNSWKDTQKIYEWVSRMRTVPFVGPLLFGIMDHFQRIEPFYPKRDLSRPTLQVREVYKIIRKGLGRHLISKLNENPLPLLTSFFITAFIAEEHGYKGNIYCLCTDSDISRAWAPFNPKESRIIYLAPTERVKERLELYGVPSEKIILTGFPLPKELLGSQTKLQIAKEALHRRVAKLDPHKIYAKKYEPLIDEYLDKGHVHSKDPISLTFAVGGAGAQLEEGVEIIKSLRTHIQEKKIRLNLVAGTSKSVYETFEKTIEKTGLFENYKNGDITILHSTEKHSYFQKFSELLLHTDILWTKPSELSFYAALGLPILMASPLGSQEDFNRAWLHVLEAGIDQEDPRYVSEWLFDWISSGRFAEAAMNGFINAPKRGTYHVESLLLAEKVGGIETTQVL